MIKVSIIGVTGYAGIELLRLLSEHPHVKIEHLLSRSHAGEKLSSVYPQYTGIDERLLEEYDLDVVKDSDLVFSALPHGVAQDIVAELRENDLRVIDLSGDYRYRKRETYEKWYDMQHKHPQLLKESVYGLVELNREKIKNALLVANPGCYPTSSLLALLPVIDKEIIEKKSIIVDAKSGVSGAGRSLSRTSHFTEADENITAYKIAEHRHVSEIEAKLGDYIHSDIKLSFTPHLIPMKRGILSTIYIDLKDNIKEDNLANFYHDFYQDSPFVQVLPPGISPDTKYVTGTNYCHLGINVDQRLRRAIIISVIDNLGKGAAGQAVQNMNIIFGFSETDGLETPAVFP